MPQSFSRCGPGGRSIVAAVIGAPARARYSATESSAESAATPRSALEAATRATTGNGARWMLVWFESLKTTGVTDVMPRRSATATAARIALSCLSLCVTVDSPASPLTRIRPLDRLICVIPQTLRVPAAYPNLERSPPAGFPTFEYSNLPVRIVRFAGRDWLRGRAAYP